jgi:hypothetical protein
MAMNSEISTFVTGALLNLLVAVLIVRLVYYPRSREKKFVFTFLAFNTIIYFVLTLLKTTDLGVGVSFGLFAIFSVLRYRTDPIPIREMTYLFILIALPVVNSVVNSDGAFWQMAVADGTVMALLFALEREWGFHFESSSRITYDKIGLFLPSQRERLLADLRDRTGLPVKRVEIGRLDFVRDSAEIKVYYDAPSGAVAVSHTNGSESRASSDE